MTVGIQQTKNQELNKTQYLQTLLLVSLFVFTCHLKSWDVIICVDLRPPPNKVCATQTKNQVENKSNNQLPHLTWNRFCNCIMNVTFSNVTQAKTWKHAGGRNGKKICSPHQNHAFLDAWFIVKPCEGLTGQEVQKDIQNSRLHAQPQEHEICSHSTDTVWSLKCSLMFEPVC